MTIRGAFEILIAASVALALSSPARASSEAEDCFRDPDVACLVRAALEGAQAATPPEYRASLLDEIAGLRAETGDAEGGRETLAAALAEAADVEEPRVRADLLCFVAQRQAKIGDATGARQTLTGAIQLLERELSKGYDESSYMLTHTLRECAAAQMTVGDAASAAATLRHFADNLGAIASPSARHEEMIVTGRAQGEVGDAEGARATFLATRHLAQSLPPGAERATQLAVVGGEQLRIGATDAGRSTLEEAVAAYSAVRDPVERHRLETLIAMQLLSMSRR
ncbi:MAG: hypothetical protein L0210_06695 [Rhodospirillales bacterium]|nr:hypothetical protein [Rhodospirillales bacterium]